MPSLLPGFEYDIFISYRQNDNKYDGWVTEFVNNLNKELEATLKDKVTVYFDSNPHDGLLETHSVSHSLEEKLKCLIFIPILSKTYCDVKSFAWNDELLAFVEKAKKDQFGLNVKLTSGNVSSRVLPVRIHDLDPEDVKLAESVIGFIRSVDFIYHSPGVNRSLRPWDDDVIKNTRQPFYRDQINKVANAIDELVRGMKLAAKSNTAEKLIVPAPHSAAVEEPIKRLKKAPRVAVSKTPVWATIAVVLVGSFSFLGFRWYANSKKVDHARTVLLPAIQKLIDENFRPPTEAYDKALEAMQVISSDSALLKLWPVVASVTPIVTEPADVEVFWKDYSAPQMEWRRAGITPVKEAAFPRGYVRMEFRKEGFQTVEYAGPFSYERLGKDIDTLRLDPIGTLPADMVRFPSKVTPMAIVGLDSYGPKKVNEFFIDRHEVTNKQYKAFVDAGGYSDPTLWQFSFYAEGKQLSFEEAMKRFVDQTGRQGPSTWEGGAYPNGQEDHPVSGLSWYEASAYAAWAKKKLPTIFHWSAAAETSRTEFIVPLSNFNGKGTTKVGSSPGYSTFGIYDIAGNVREWCSNETDPQGVRFIMGGGWNDETYSFNDSYSQSEMDRSPGNGFRCIREIGEDAKDLNIKVDASLRDYTKEKPVDDKTFEIFRRQFAYDNTPLHDSVSVIESNEFCTVEKITFEAGYNNERMQAYIFLPKNAKPPYQPILFFPGSNDIFSRKFDVRFPLSRVDFFIKNGRAIVLPVYKGTHERHDELKSDLQEETVFYKDHVIMWRKDIGRTIDYLETRKDIQVDKLAYLGWSWGGFMGGIMPAVEKRIKVVVLNVGGMEMHKTLPEVDQINFIPRVTQPVLMLNGKHDMFFPVETSQKPMFNLLGTPAKDKKIVICESGHLVPRTEFVRESLMWLDKYLGPAK
jgi:dienelactone hydrolase